MNKIDFNQVGGFPLTTNILGKLQTAFTLFNALGNIAGDMTIISGCEVVGSTVANGVVYWNGEVLEFKGGTAQSKVILREEIENLVFGNQNSYPSIKNRYVAFGTGTGAVNWSDFKRGFATKDILASLLGKADQASFDALSSAFTLVYEKMLTIDVGAEKNVQHDWNQTDDTKDDYIKNKPGVISFLKKGTYQIGDLKSVDELRTVSFDNVGTNNYMVIGTLVSNSSDFDRDNDVFFVIREKTDSSFKLGLREVSGIVQNLSFEYILIPL